MTQDSFTIKVYNVDQLCIIFHLSRCKCAFLCITKNIRINQENTHEKLIKYIVSVCSFLWLYGLNVPEDYFWESLLQRALQYDDSFKMCVQLFFRCVDARCNCAYSVQKEQYIFQTVSTCFQLKKCMSLWLSFVFVVQMWIVAGEKGKLLFSYYKNSQHLSLSAFSTVKCLSDSFPSFCQFIIVRLVYAS